MTTATTVAPAIHILPLPAFKDNYLWVLRAGADVAVVDPGDAAPVLDYLQRTDGRLRAVLITHHHGDHIGGLATLLKTAPGIPVYGPASENIAGLTAPLAGGEHIALPAGFGADAEFDVLAVPGHTAGHLAYYGPKLGAQCQGALFCGDTLFGAGCGRLFEGTAAQMQASLARIAVLPAPTLVYCAHEYTQANLRFACTVEPDNAATQARAAEVAAARSRGAATVPFTLAGELATNPFLRWDVPAVRAAAQVQLGRPAIDAADTFAAIRHWKDEFR